MRYPNPIILQEVQNLIIFCDTDEKRHALRRRVGRLEDKVPLLFQMYMTWDNYRFKIKEKHRDSSEATTETETQKNNADLTKLIFGLRIAEGSFAMLLALAELNETPGEESS